MLERILDYERDLFLWLNGSDSILFDHFMWLVSEKLVWIPWILCFLWVLFYKKDWREGLLVVLFIVVLITICDQVASGIFKPIFHRFRPTHHPDFMNEVKILFDYRGGHYGFASSHASNAFGVATFSVLLIKNRIFTVSVVLFALLNSYSRIYLGVHFISDIVAGAMIGILTGVLCYQLYTVSRKYLLKVQTPDLNKPIYSRKDSYLLSSCLWIIFLILLILNKQLVKMFQD